MLKYNFSLERLKRLFKIKRKDKKDGFTLMELVTVLAVISILSAALIPKVGNYINEAKKVYGEDKEKLNVLIEHSSHLEMKLQREIEVVQQKQKDLEYKRLRLKEKEEEMQNFDAFSPRKQKSNLKDTISNLEKENQMFHQKIEEMKEQKKKLDAEILKISSVLKYFKENYMEKKDLTLSSKGKKKYQKLQERYQGELGELIHKIEFCFTLIDLDPVRCKIELSALLNHLYSKKEKREETERAELVKDKEE